MQNEESAQSEREKEMKHKKWNERAKEENENKQWNYVVGMHK